MVPELSPGPELSASRALGGQAALSLDINLPNLITLARLLSVPLAVWLILEDRYAAAFWVFIGAGLSDALDGYIAKRFNRQTRLGAMLDPAADKVLLAGVYMTLGIVGQLPAWLVMLVVSRDLLIVIGFVVIHASAATPKPVGPLFISKINTLIQIVLVGFVLARLGLGFEADAVMPPLIGAAALTTLLSGSSYLLQCARLYRSEPVL
jgi:cardiolipin synthase (CMP-forming)